MSHVENELQARNRKGQHRYKIIDTCVAGKSRCWPESDLSFEISMVYDGRGGGIRTPDPLLPKQMRYQTALRPEPS